MNNIILTIAITIIVLAIQHFMSTRKNWIFGAFFPIAYITFFIWFMITNDINYEIILRLCIGLVILLGIWSDGRAKVKKNLSKEMDKMISKDIA